MAAWPLRFLLRLCFVDIPRLLMAWHFSPRFITLCTKKLQRLFFCAAQLSQGVFELSKPTLCCSCFVGRTAPAWRLGFGSNTAHLFRRRGLIASELRHESELVTIGPTGSPRLSGRPRSLLLL